MNKSRILLVFLMLLLNQTPIGAQKKMPYPELTPEEERVILHKGTESSFTGRYVDFHEKGTYACKRCGAELYRSEDKFDSECGWPSFDDEIPGAVKRGRGRISSDRKAENRIAEILNDI